MEKLDFRFEIKEMKGDAGTFTGLASAYGKLDLAGEIVERGAFTQTLKHRDSVPILYQHDPREPIGIGKLEDSREGLIIHGKLSLTANPTAQKAHQLAKDGVLRGLSIGYDLVRKEVRDGIRYLKEIKLWEVSLVTFPCCEQALVSDVKSARQQLDEQYRELEEFAYVANLKTLFHHYRFPKKGLL